MSKQGMLPLFIRTEVKPFSFRRAAKPILKNKYLKYRVNALPAKTYMEAPIDISRPPKLMPVQGVPNLLQDPKMMPSDVFLHVVPVHDETCHKSFGGVLQIMWPPRPLAEDGSFKPALAEPYDLDAPYGVMLHDPVHSGSITDINKDNEVLYMWVPFVFLGLFWGFPILLTSFQLTTGPTADVLEAAAALTFPSNTPLPDLPEVNEWIYSSKNLPQ